MRRSRGRDMECEMKEGKGDRESEGKAEERKIDDNT